MTNSRARGLAAIIVAIIAVASAAMSVLPSARAAAGASLHGTVAGAGKPLAGVHVTLYAGSHDGAAISTIAAHDFRLPPIVADRVGH
jgi:hypothetical protein